MAAPSSHFPLRGILSNLKEFATWNNVRKGREDEYQPAHDISNGWALRVTFHATCQGSTPSHDYVGNQRQSILVPITDKGHRKQREKFGAQVSKDYRQKAAQSEGGKMGWLSKNQQRTQLLAGAPSLFSYISNTFVHLRLFSPQKFSIVFYFKQDQIVHTF